MIGGSSSFRTVGTKFVVTPLCLIGQRTGREDARSILGVWTIDRELRSHGVCSDPWILRLTSLHNGKRIRLIERISEDDPKDTGGDKCCRELRYYLQQFYGKEYRFSVPDGSTVETSEGAPKVPQSLCITRLVDRLVDITTTSGTFARTSTPHKKTRTQEEYRFQGP